MLQLFYYAVSFNPGHNVFIYIVDICLFFSMHILHDKYYIKVVLPCMDLWGCIIKE
jgi:hypothetical protein